MNKCFKQRKICVAWLVILGRMNKEKKQKKLMKRMER